MILCEDLDPLRFKAMATKADVATIIAEALPSLKDNNI